VGWCPLRSKTVSSVSSTRTFFFSISRMVCSLFMARCTVRTSKPMRLAMVVDRGNGICCSYHQCMVRLISTTSSVGLSPSRFCCLSRMSGQDLKAGIGGVAPLACGGQPVGMSGRRRFNHALPDRFYNEYLSGAAVCVAF
jgi:hypothetical protein